MLSSRDTGGPYTRPNHWEMSLSDQPCSRCKGKGTVRAYGPYSPEAVEIKCPKCDGTGKAC